MSVRLSLAANSILSWTDRYFCLSKLDSRVWSWLSVKAVLAFLCFLEKLEELEFWLRSSSPATEKDLSLRVEFVIGAGPNWLTVWMDYVCRVTLIRHAHWELTGEGPEMAE